MVWVSWSGAGSRPDDHVHRLPNRKAFLGIHPEQGDPTYTPAFRTRRLEGAWGTRGPAPVSPTAGHTVWVRLVGEAAKGAGVNSHSQSSPGTCFST